MEKLITRRKTRPIFVGCVQVGGDAPVVVQSMTSTDTRDVAATVEQIRRLAAAGCEIVRVAVPDEEAAERLGAIKKSISLPLIADIHFRSSLALSAIRQGVDGIRINPGNIPAAGFRDIVRAATAEGTAIRIGINAGSLEKDLLAKHGGPTAEALAESALRNAALVEELGCSALKISIKSSDVLTTIAACKAVADRTTYPLHLGVTEAGSLVSSAIKSSLGIGTLLLQGIGDTIRVSVTGDPVAELGVAYGILRALHIRTVGPDIISCPTCGRCEVDLVRLVGAVEEGLAGMRQYLKVALMGCAVNGPGEAAEADVGIAAGRGSGLLFRRGEVIRRVDEKDFVPVLLAEIHDMIREK